MAISFDSTPSMGDVLLSKLARRLSSRREKTIAVRSWFQAMVKVLVQLAGFACLTLAGFSVSFTVGMVVAGLSCFTFAWLVPSGASNNTLTPDPILRR
jgi:hypothetical protein